MLRTFKIRVVRRTFWLIKMVPTWKKFEKRWLNTWSQCSGMWHPVDWHVITDVLKTHSRAAWHMMMKMMMMMKALFFPKGKNLLADRASHPRRIESSGLRLTDFHPWNTKTCRSVSVVKRTEIYSSQNNMKNLMMDRSCARGKFKAFLRRNFLKELEKEFILTSINNTVFILLRLMECDNKYHVWSHSRRDDLVQTCF